MALKAVASRPISSWVSTLARTRKSPFSARCITSVSRPRGRLIKRCKRSRLVSAKSPSRIPVKTKRPR